MLICLDSGKSLCRDKLDELCGAVADELEIVRGVLEACEWTRQNGGKKRVVRPFSYLLMGFLFEP
ncbi:MAG: hypothetical protein OEZ18_02025 [Candidatus Bathyarchaeota archaeon]|nr:hypothetical protein [Candidatus Bathyarchaeota archaeon]